MTKRKTILQLDFMEAKNFFLEEKSYCNFDLPQYIKFESLLKAIDTKIKEKSGFNFESIGGRKAKNFDNINYKLFNNKNGKYDWRPFELINPFIYVYLVCEITKQENWEFIQDTFKNLIKIIASNVIVSLFNHKVKNQIKPSKFWNGGKK